MLGASGCGNSTRPAAAPSRPIGVPLSPFGARSTAEEVSAGIDLGGTLVLVTGATSGLGFETLRVLALRGAHVIATGRTLRSARPTRVPQCHGRTTPLALDLEDWASVAAAAKTVVALGRPLDVLVCNAGIMNPPTLRLVNGVEQQFAVNHLGHFVLCHHLLEPLRAAPQGRVVMVSSWLYRHGAARRHRLRQPRREPRLRPAAGVRPVEARQPPLRLRAGPADVRHARHRQRAAPRRGEHQPRSRQPGMASPGRPAGGLEPAVA